MFLNVLTKLPNNGQVSESTNILKFQPYQAHQLGLFLHASRLCYVVHEAYDLFLCELWKNYKMHSRYIHGYGINSVFAHG